VTLWLSPLCVSVLLCVSAACRRSADRAPAAGPAAPQTSGTLAVAGISAPVSVARDRWGVPHITASTQDDLFFAQGFVQAQDRLFQMDLWRRSVQGRLSEVLGSNFIERDIMTRRIQYAGDTSADWASYGPDARDIASAFVRGINAWVALAREQPPEEFTLAGWRPEVWQPDDLLNRTDAFLASGSALDEVLRARIVSAVGLQESAAAFAPPARRPARGDSLFRAEGRTTIPRGLDPRAVGFGVADALRRVGTPPFFMSLHSADSPAGISPAAPNRGPREGGRGSGSNAWTVAPRRSATAAAILASDPHRAFEHPSHWYVVHLRAPDWNAIGATPPWLPGVAIGHNDRIAWSMTALDADVQDLFVEKTNPANPHQIEEQGRWIDTRRADDAIVVRGRTKPFAFQHERTDRGPVIAIDREHNLAFTVRWTGDEPGTAAGLAASAIDRARSWPEFRAALARWKAPAIEALYADVDGNIGRQAAALVPRRRGWDGVLPAPGWTGGFGWREWQRPEDLPHELNPRIGHLVAANSGARTERIAELFAASDSAGVEDFRLWQQDVTTRSATSLLPFLAAARADRSDVEAARQRLVTWDRRVASDSSTATLYVLWEQALIRLVAERTLGAALADEYVKASADWPRGFPDRLRRYPRIAIDALIVAVDEWRGKREPAWGSLHQVLFRHPLAVTDRTRARFDVGPFPIGGYAATVMATYGRGAGVDGGPSFRQIVDLGDWDRSIATNAPGQSGSPASPHFADLARGWAAGEYFPLVFRDAAIQSTTESTLTLVPSSSR
jgi:penicillin G amidase